MERRELRVPARQGLQVGGRAKRRAGLVREGAERLEPLARRQERVLGVVGPDEAEKLASTVEERHDQPVPVPGSWPEAVANRRVARVPRRVGDGDLAREEEAALDLVVGIEESPRLGRADREVERGIGQAPARSTARHEPAGTVGGGGDDLLEAECLLDPPRDRAEHRLDGLELGQPRRDLEQVDERRAVARGGRRRLCRLDRKPHVRGHRAEQLELVVAGHLARFRLVDGEDPEQRAVRSEHRGDQPVLRMPGVPTLRRNERREVDGSELAPVELAVRDEVDAAAPKALLEHRRPGREPRGRPEQELARVGAAVHGHHLEVVPARPVEVDDRRAKPEALAQDRGDSLEQRGCLVLLMLESEQLEQSAEMRKRRSVQCRRRAHSTR